MEKSKLSLSQKEKIKTNLKDAYENINEVLAKTVYIGKVEITEKIKIFNDLFSDYGDKPFEVKISQSEFREIKKISKEKLFKKNKALKEAILKKESAIQRQFFRNYQIFKIFDEKLFEYIELLKKNKSLNKLIKLKGSIGDITSSYKNRRISNADYFQNEIKLIINGSKNDIVIDDISWYCKLFCDFFEQEIDYLLIFLRNIKNILNDHEEAKEEIKERTKIKELNLEFPLINETL